MEQVKQRRGFAALSPERLKVISAMGGKRAQQMGVAHRWDATTSAAAGRKGGKAPRVPRAQA